MTLSLKLEPLVAGHASGEVLKLEAGLSFWGGLEPATGIIVDRQHPQLGECISGSILVLPSPRGSTAAPGALLECLAAGRGPAAIVLAQDDITPVAAVLAGAIIDLPPIPVARLKDSGYLDQLASGMGGELYNDTLLLRKGPT